MNPLAEAEAVALILEHQDGWAHVYADGSANWASRPPDPGRWPFPDDCPEAVPLRRYRYHEAKALYRAAVRKLRARGVFRAS